MIIMDHERYIIHFRISNRRHLAGIDKELIMHFIANVRRFRCAAVNHVSRNSSIRRACRNYADREYGQDHSHNKQQTD